MIPRKKWFPFVISHERWFLMFGLLLLVLSPGSLGSHGWLLVSKIPPLTDLVCSICTSRNPSWDSTDLQCPSRCLHESLKHPCYSSISLPPTAFLRLLLTCKNVLGILFRFNLDYPNIVPLYWTRLETWKPSVLPSAFRETDFFSWADRVDTASVIRLLWNSHPRLPGGFLSCDRGVLVGPLESMLLVWMPAS